MRKRWNRQKLNNLYNIQGKTLQQIGDIFNVSRERVRQVMNQFNISRTRHRHHLVPVRYKELNDYLANPNKHRAGEDYLILRRLLPNLACSECGSKKNIHFHHINYPATSQEDIQILCASCHKIKHMKGMTLTKQIDLYIKYRSGIPVPALANEYNISKPCVYMLIKKIRNSQHTYRG